MNIDLCSTTLKKLNAKIIPFIIICYFVANLDKTNISVAALQMNADLGLSASMYGLGVGMFYISYIIFEIPSNVIMTRVGARIWIARIMITWGIVSAGMSLVQTPTQLYVMRFLLGMAEAGFTPGIIYYISCWFPKSNRARAMSFFYMGSVLASVIGLPISGSILNMHGIADIAGWRWLFAMEGIPAIILGCLVLLRLPDTPNHATWLSADEKKWL
ncbi:TPA: MFS transporter, partial [Yersinia enterocolitica]